MLPLESLPEQPFRYLAKPEERQELARRVAELVRKVQEEQVDQLIFLDKSSRPLVTLFSDLWENASPGKPKPPISFLNIGKETAEVFNVEEVSPDFRSPLYRGDDNFEGTMAQVASPEDLTTLLNIPPEVIKETRKRYRYLQEADTQAAAGTPIRVLVVDEHIITGETLTFAQKVIQGLFPHLTIETYPISSDEDPVFASQLTKNVPWHSEVPDTPRHGVSGVIDPQVIDPSSRSFTAAASHHMTDEIREAPFKKALAASEEEQKKALDTLEKTSEQIEEDIAQFREEHKEFDEIFQEMMLGFNEGYQKNAELRKEILRNAQLVFGRAFATLVEPYLQKLAGFAPDIQNLAPQRAVSELAEKQKEIRALQSLDFDGHVKPLVEGYIAELPVEGPIKKGVEHIALPEVLKALSAAHHIKSRALIALGDIRRTSETIKKTSEDLASLRPLHEEVHALRQEMHQAADEFQDQQAS